MPVTICIIVMPGPQSYEDYCSRFYRLSYHLCLSSVHYCQSTDLHILFMVLSTSSSCRAISPQGGADLCILSSQQDTSLHCDAMDTALTWAFTGTHCTCAPSDGLAKLTWVACCISRWFNHVPTVKYQPDSATCPYCNGVDETAEHLVLHCSAHEQVRRDIWPGGQFNMDPRRLWDFLERIGAVTRPPDREWEREREYQPGPAASIDDWDHVKPPTNRVQY